jgi:hypothetical protein
MRHLFCIALALVACSKKSEDKPAPVADKPPAPAPEPAPAKEPHSPAEIWDWAKQVDDKGGVESLELFNKGVTLTATVGKIDDPPAGEYKLSFDAGGGHTVFASFFVGNKPDKPIKVGDAVSLHCEVTKPKPDTLALVNCERK